MNLNFCIYQMKTSINDSLKSYKCNYLLFERKNNYLHVLIHCYLYNAQ